MIATKRGFRVFLGEISGRKTGVFDVSFWEEAHQAPCVFNSSLLDLRVPKRRVKTNGNEQNDGRARGSPVADKMKWLACRCRKVALFKVDNSTREVIVILIRSIYLQLLRNCEPQA